MRTPTQATDNSASVPAIYHQRRQLKQYIRFPGPLTVHLIYLTIYKVIHFLFAERGQFLPEIVLIFEISLEQNQMGETTSYHGRDITVLLCHNKIRNVAILN